MHKKNDFAVHLLLSIIIMISHSWVNASHLYLIGLHFSPAPCISNVLLCLLLQGISLQRTSFLVLKSDKKTLR